MAFADRLTRRPIAHDAEGGREAAARVSVLAAPLRALVAGAAGCSPYLAGLVAAEADWLGSTLAGEPEAVFADLLTATRASEPAHLGTELRRVKRRVALLVALADLGGVWDLDAVTGALSDFADVALDTAMHAHVAAEVRRGKLAGADVTGSRTAGMIVLAMGKLGARELNFSSDIDLIILFDERLHPDPDAARAALVRVTRKLTTTLSEPTGEGYVFRTDLRLRPDAGTTPVCLPMEAAERYYESLGRTWERAAYIKARPCAGDIAAGAAFLDRLRPFVWRRHLDFAAVEDAHDMRRRLRAQRGLAGPITLEGHDMKLGRGGIREIELLAQTNQIIAGGRDPELRERATLPALDRLAAKGWIDAAVAEKLATAYRAHREVEHRLQMVDDVQTHSLPTGAEGIDRLARFMGRSDSRAFRAELHARLVSVADLAEKFFAPGAGSASGEALTDVCDGAGDIVSRWQDYPALRSERAQRIFARLEPELAARLGRAAQPDEALAALDAFLAGLPAGVQIFALFETNPALIELILDICTTAPALAAHLARNPGVLDAVLGGDFFAPWPGCAALREELAARLSGAGDYERRLDAARRWAREWRFRIGVHFLRDLIDPATAERHYAELAEATVAALWPVVAATFADKHGPPPGRGAVVLAMGSLGAGRLTATSDLDLIVVYDAAGADSSDGPRPLAARAYYARLTQALVTALSARTAEGRLYDVDMRLRPSGQQGPVATSLEAFGVYQREDAWAWEHLALTRARPVAGAADLGDEVERLRREVLAEKADPSRTRPALADMRRRLAEAGRTGDGPWDVGNGPGRARDIELTATAVALMAASPARRVAEQIAAGAAGGCLTQDDARRLTEAHALFRRVQVAARLISDAPLAPDALGASGRAFLLRATGTDDMETLARTIGRSVERAAVAVDHVAGRGPLEP